MDNKVRETIRDVYCPTCRNEKCVYILTKKTTGFYDCKNCKACCHVLNILFKDQKLTIMLFGDDGTHCFAVKTSRDDEKEKPSPFLKYFLRQSQPSTSEPEPKKVESIHLWHNRVDTPLVDTVNQNFVYIIFLNVFSLHESNKILSVSNYGIERSLDFGPDSVTLTVQDLVQEMTISSQEIPLAAQRQQFLNNHLARVPVFPNQQGTHEMRDGVLSSVGAQDMDTSRYQVPDLGDVEFYWENDQLDVDALLRTGLDTPFSPKTFQDLEMGGGQAENPILLDEEEDKENSPPLPTTPVSER